MTGTEHEPAMAANDEEPGLDDQQLAIIAELLESLGEDGPQQLEFVGSLMTELGELVAAAPVAMESGSIAAVEEVGRRAKLMKARSESVPIPWALALIEGGESFVAAFVHLGRGMSFTKRWLHDRAKDEYRTAHQRMAEGGQLFLSAIADAPPWPGLAEAFVPAAKMAEAWASLTMALEEQADLDIRLLSGQIGDYVAGVRRLAAAMTTQSDAVLTAGAEEDLALKVSRQLSDQAEVLRLRADAVEQFYRTGRHYLPVTGDKVFIVHGHDEAKWRELRDLLEDRFGLRGRVVVLKEAAGRSETIIEKFAEMAGECSYAIALVTPDDLVSKPDASYGQARPNVLFEIGWFFGRYGPKRLCLLKHKTTELPSDLGGVQTLDFDTDVAEQLLGLEKELKAAGVIP